RASSRSRRAVRRSGSRGRAARCGRRRLARCSPPWSCARRPTSCRPRAAGAAARRAGAPRCRRTAGRARARPPRRREERRARGGASILAAVKDVAAPVLGPRAFVVAVGLRLLLAEAHRLDLVLARAEQDQHFLHAVGAALAEADVVLAAAALVGVALDHHARARVLAQVLGVRLDQAAVLVLHVELVQVVEDRALRQRAVRVLERGERARLRLADVDRGDLRRLHRLRRRARLAAALVLDLGGGLVLGRGRAGRADQQTRSANGGDDDGAHGCLSFHSMNGPQAGSRTSPPANGRRCLMRPSAETAASTPRPPITVASRIILPLGAKLGDSSRSLSVMTCTWRFDRSKSATWNLPALRVT